MLGYFFAPMLAIFCTYVGPLLRLCWAIFASMLAHFLSPCWLFFTPMLAHFLRMCWVIFHLFRTCMGFSLWAWRAPNPVCDLSPDRWPTWDSINWLFVDVSQWVTPTAVRHTRLITGSVLHDTLIRIHLALRLVIPTASSCPCYGAMIPFYV